jgi:hypothetical protein
MVTLGTARGLTMRNPLVAAVAALAVAGRGGAAGVSLLGVFVAGFVFAAAKNRGDAESLSVRRAAEAHRWEAW